MYCSQCCYTPAFYQTIPSFLAVKKSTYLNKQNNCPPPPEYVVAKWNFICRFVEEKQMCKKIVGFCDKISNSDSSATIYRLASFEIYVKWEI